MVLDNIDMQDLHNNFDNISSDPDEFGIVMWNYLHKYANSNGYSKEWLDEFTSLIPCSECRGHFKEFSHPQVGESFARWAFDRHNDVNKRLEKPLFTEEEYLKRWNVTLK